MENSKMIKSLILILILVFGIGVAFSSINYDAFSLTQYSATQDVPPPGGIFAPLSVKAETDPPKQPTVVPVAVLPDQSPKTSEPTVVPGEVLPETNKPTEEDYNSYSVAVDSSGKIIGYLPSVEISDGVNSFDSAVKVNLAVQLGAKTPAELGDILDTYNLNPQLIPSERLKAIKNAGLSVGSIDGWVNVQKGINHITGKIDKIEKLIELCEKTPTGLGCGDYNTAEKIAKAKAGIEAYKKDSRYMERLMEENMDIETQGEFLAGLTSSDEREAFAELITAQSCSESFFTTLCKIFESKSTSQIARDSFYAKVESYRGLDEMTVEEYNNKVFADVEARLSPKISGELDLYYEMRGMSPCKDVVCIDKVLSDIECANADDECKKQLYDAKGMLDAAEGSTMVKETTFSNVAFNMIDFMKNYDKNAVKAAELFGAEPNYDNVPEFLNEDISSSICAAKIDGYLDTEKPNEGGVTGYEQEVVDGKRVIKQTYDLRAQKTPMTPDNRTTISYSYFIRAPEDSSIKYSIGIGYLANNVIKKAILIDSQNISGGGKRTNFDVASIELEDANRINEQSFTIFLRATRTNEADIYIDTYTSIVPITVSDTYNGESVTGNHAGYEAALFSALSETMVPDAFWS